jgi:acyl-CoA thioesterase-1
MSEDIVKEDFKFIVSGDSISKGVVYDETQSKYVILQDNYVALLKNKLKGIVSNTAKFGNTIIKGTNRLKSDISNHDYDIALIEYGGNDSDFNWNEIAEHPKDVHKPNTDYGVFENKLTEIVNFIKTSKIVPVLMTIPPLNAERYLKWVSMNNPLTELNILKWLGSVTKIYWWQERYNAAILNVAEETNTKFIDVRGAFLKYPDFSEFLCIDGIHPNKGGHKIIADKVFDFVRSGYDYLIKDKTDLQVLTRF